MYPPAPRVDLIEIHHGVAVADPFRALEDAEDPATAAWVTAENALTRRLLDGPGRDRLVARLRELHRYPRSSVPMLRGGRLFFIENDGTKNQGVLYVADVAPGPSGSGKWADEAGLRIREQGKRPLVDPNALDPDGTTAVTAFEADDRGERVVYALSRSGSDIQDLFVHDVANGADCSDRIRWAKFASIAWSADGFFYTRFPAPGTVPPEHEQYFCQVWFHRLGHPQTADRLVYERPDAPEVVFEVDVTSDGRHLVITSRRGASDNAEVHVVDVESGASRINEIRPLVTGFANGWHFAGSAGTRVYFRTDAGAPRGRIVRWDLDHQDGAPHVIVAESADKIDDAAVAAGRLVVSALRNASSRVHTFDLDGSARGELALPGIGTILGIAARWDEESCYVTFTSFTMPPRIFACDFDARRIVMIDRAELPVDPASYVTEQVWYPSKDGTLISMFLVRRAGAARPAPVLLSGYGGFNISMTPAFDPSDFLWLDAGGVVGVANLRGGGEYGEAWHQAGMRERKQNVFDDFIAAAEWLQATGRSTAGGIAIEGGSNGGLLVSAAMIQRPDLFGAVICRVPVADMLRYHLFTVGRFWIPEYGSADDPEQFAYLYRYSPYHQVIDGVAYPPALVMTADTDDRVAPGMAKKFAARLQEATLSGAAAPILLRVETRAGHGAGKPLNKQIDEQADIYEFLFAYLPRKTASAQQGRLHI